MLKRKENSARKAHLALVVSVFSQAPADLRCIFLLNSFHSADWLGHRRLEGNVWSFPGCPCGPCRCLGSGGAGRTVRGGNGFEKTSRMAQRRSATRSGSQ